MAAFGKSLDEIFCRFGIIFDDKNSHNIIIHDFYEKADPVRACPVPLPFYFEF